MNSGEDFAFFYWWTCIRADGLARGNSYIYYIAREAKSVFWQCEWKKIWDGEEEARRWLNERRSIAARKAKATRIQKGNWWTKNPPPQAVSTASTDARNL